MLNKAGNFFSGFHLSIFVGWQMWAVTASIPSRKTQTAQQAFR